MNRRSVEPGAWVYRLVAPALLAVAMQGATAAPVVYDFDTLASGTAVTNQFAGLTFANATVITASGGLNDRVFPPRSGEGVVLDDGGAMTIDFAGPVFSVTGFITYVDGPGFSFSAFDSANHLIGSDLADFGSNMLLFGDAGSSPNERFTVSSASGSIARLVITGDARGASFTLDDLTVDNSAVVAQAPEPQTLALVLGVLAFGFTRQGWLRLPRRARAGSRCSPSPQACRRSRHPAR